MKGLSRKNAYLMFNFKAPLLLISSIFFLTFIMTVYCYNVPPATAGNIRLARELFEDNTPTRFSLLEVTPRQTFWQVQYQVIGPKNTGIEKKDIRSNKPSNTRITELRIIQENPARIYNVDYYVRAGNIEEEFWIGNRENKSMNFSGLTTFNKTFRAIKSDRRETEKNVNSLFQEIGFSPSCVSQTLADCENSANNSPLLGIKSMLVSLQRTLDLEIKAKHFPRNCAELLDSGDNITGVRTVYPFSCCSNRPVSVYCDQATDGGGWTVFQHREDLPQREDFFRTWTEYKLGFGNLTGEFWLGLDNIHALASQTLMELRVDLEDFDGDQRWAKYEFFYIGDADTNYKLSIGKYSGTAGDSLDHQQGMMFSTKDSDNDKHDIDNCAEKYKGAWWYQGCLHSNLNGYQYEKVHKAHAAGINWHHFRGLYYSLKKTSLAIRPKFRT